MKPIPLASSSADQSIPFEFRWRDEGGQWTSLTCWAKTQAEAEDAARRAGWPGHDGTRLGQYRAWLKDTLQGDEKA